MSSIINDAWHEISADQSRSNIAVLIAGILCSTICVAQSPASVDTSQWLEYSNASVGLSFRYPSFLTVQEDKTLASLMQPQAVETVIELIGKTESSPKGQSIFRFIVYRRRPTNQSPPVNAYWPNDDPRGCKLSRHLILDKHRAFFCESCGTLSGRCYWEILILQPRICAMFPMYEGRELDGSHPEKGPQDGGFPIRSIINTVHFRSADPFDEPEHPKH